MALTKVAVMLEQTTVVKLDELVQRKVFPTRNDAIQEAVLDKLKRLDKTRLVQECAKLEPQLEQAMAEEGMTEVLEEWPEY